MLEAKGNINKAITAASGIGEMAKVEREAEGEKRKALFEKGVKRAVAEMKISPCFSVLLLFKKQRNAVDNGMRIPRRA